MKSLLPKPQALFSSLFGLLYNNQHESNSSKEILGPKALRDGCHAPSDPVSENKCEARLAGHSWSLSKLFIFRLKHAQRLMESIYFFCNLSFSLMPQSAECSFISLSLSRSLPKSVKLAFAPIANSFLPLIG